MKNLKLIIVTLILSLTSIFSNAQMHVDSFYLDKSEFLIYNVIEVLDSMSQEQIGIKTKNWAGINFVNMKEVLVSETKEQLVFNYTTKYSIKGIGQDIIFNHYIRMIIQIKDNKIKISMYDGGNASPQNSSKLINLFGKDGTCRKMYIDCLESVKNSCINTANDLIKSLKSNTVKDKKTIGKTKKIYFDFSHLKTWLFLCFFNFVGIISENKKPN
jgi:hypothetical protein